MSRRGTVRRRCSTCGRTVEDRSCTSCPQSRSTWSFVVDIGAVGGRRRQVRRGGFDTKREAVDEMGRLQESVRTSTYVEPSGQLVAGYLQGWLNGLPATGLEQSTVAAYRSLMEVHAIPELGDEPLQSLDPMMLDRLYAKMLREGRRDGRGGLSPRTTRFTHTVLRKALADAVRKGLLVANPADRATPPSTKAASPPEMKFWTPEELYVFLGSIDTNARLFCMWRVLALTGLRRGEAAGLRWQDVDLEGDEQDPGRIRVAQQYKPDGKGGFVFGAPKSEQGRRTVNLDPETVVVLRDHRQRQLDERSRLGLSDRPQLVFTNVDGGPIRPDSGISKRFDRLVRETDLPRIRLHDLRHTHCAHLIASGTDLKAISTRLGHASVSFTLDRYGHLLPGRQAEAAARVAAMVDDFGRNPPVRGRRQEL